MGVRLGLVIATHEVPAQQRAVPWTDIRDMARAAEEVGFDSVWLPDELLWPMETGPMGFWECVSVLAAVAATTSRVEVGTSVMCVTYRNPALVAKIATTVDEISGGRFVLGLGAGYPKEVHPAYGYANDHQYGRFREALLIIASLLRTGETTFDGEFHQVEEALIQPRHRDEGPPILVAAGKPKMLRLAAEHADRWNWFSFGESDPEHFADQFTGLDDACAEVGRDPATLPRTLDLPVAPTGETATMPYSNPIVGSAEELAATFHALGTAGVDEVRALVWPPKAQTVEAMAPVVDLL